MLSDINNDEKTKDAEHEGYKWEDCTPYDYAIELIFLFDPHLFLFIFLPALLFESAFGIDYHIF